GANHGTPSRSRVPCPAWTRMFRGLHGSLHGVDEGRPVEHTGQIQLAGGARAPARVQPGLYLAAKRLSVARRSVSSANWSAADAAGLVSGDLSVAAAAEGLVVGSTGLDGTFSAVPPGPAARRSIAVCSHGHRAGR